MDHDDETFAEQVWQLAETENIALTSEDVATLFTAQARRLEELGCDKEIIADALLSAGLAYAMAHFGVDSTRQWSETFLARGYAAGVFKPGTGEETWQPS